MRSGDDEPIFVRILETSGRNGGRKMCGVFVAKRFRGLKPNKDSRRSETVGGFASTPRELVRIHKLAALLAGNLLLVQCKSTQRNVTTQKTIWHGVEVGIPHTNKY